MQKASLLLVNLFIMCFQTLAQTPEDQPNDGIIKKGTWLAGSYFNFSNSTTSKNRVFANDTESSQIKLGGNVTGGKMISDHWAFLLNLGYVSSKSVTPATLNGTTYNLGDERSDLFIAPSFRYYQLMSEGTYFFVQGIVYTSFGTLNVDEFDRNNLVTTYNFNTNGLGFNISPGITYFMTKKLSTEIAIGILGYSILKGSDEFGNKTETDTFQFLFYQNSVSLGFVFYF